MKRYRPALRRDGDAFWVTTEEDPEGEYCRFDDALKLAEDARAKAIELMEKSLALAELRL